MSEQRKLVAWCPHHAERFVVGSNNLRLFEVAKARAQTTISDTFSASSSSAFNASATLTSSYSSASPSPSPALSDERANILSSTGHTSIHTHNQSNVLPLTTAAAASLSSLLSPSQPVIVKSTNPGDSASVLSGVTVTKNFRLLDTIAYPQQSVNCIGWGLDPVDPLLLGAGLLSGRLALLRFLDEQKVIKEFVPRYARTCHALAWNSLNHALIAVGLDRVRNGYGTLIWDLNQRGNQQPTQSVSSSNPTAPANTFSIQATRAPEVVVEMESSARVSNSEASVAVSWFPFDEFCLAVGTGFKWLRTYDIRNPSRPMLSVVAHSKSVFGVKFDECCQFRLGTFSEDGIVKLWDIRTLRAPVLSMLTTTPNRVSQNARDREREREANKPKPLVDLEFCTTTPGMIATLSKEDDFVRLWNISGVVSSTANDDMPAALSLSANNVAAQQSEPSITENIPCRKQLAAAGGFVSSLSWHPTMKQRMLLVTVNGMVEDISLHDDVPIRFSPLNTFAFACDDSLFFTDDITAQPEFAPLLYDTATVMRVRAELGYAMDISTNQRITANLQQQDLNRLWNWMSHCESIRAASPTHSSNAQASRGRFAGLLSVLLPTLSLKRIRENARNGIQSMHAAKDSTDLSNVGPTNISGLLAALTPSTLVDTSHCIPHSFKVYSSAARSEALRLCGWWNTFAAARGAPSTEHINLENALRNLEERGEYERAAALAVFHLDLPRALLALQKGAEKSRGAPSTTASKAIDLDLIAMALSGYAAIQQAANEDMNEASNGLWSGGWVGSLHHRNISQHLKAIFSFLSTHAAQQPAIQSYRAILENSALDLRDRLAFAARFLPDDQLCEYVQRCAVNALTQGDLDGLILTGLGADGIELLSAYVDRTADIQTTAILAAFAHANLHTENDNELDQRLHMWILIYKELLNRWRLWTARAKFDVSRSLLISAAANQSAAQNTNSAASASFSGTVAKAKKVGSLNIQPQVHVRCNFCGQTLSFEGLSGPAGKSQARHLAHSNFRSRLAGNQTRAADSSSRVQICPACKKSLPRCALCLVPLDISTANSNSSANQFSSLTQRNIKRRGEEHEDTKTAEQDLFDQSATSEFGKYFSWCCHCRHGGHAEHMMQWFRSHSECPVTDCNCRCMTLNL